MLVHEKPAVHGWHWVAPVWLLNEPGVHIVGSAVVVTHEWPIGHTVQTVALVRA